MPLQEVRSLKELCGNGWLMKTMKTQHWTIRVLNLKKCPEKAKLFEAICKLFKPLTDIAYECPKLLGHL